MKRLVLSFLLLSFLAGATDTLTGAGAWVNPSQSQERASGWLFLARKTGPVWVGGGIEAVPVVGEADRNWSLAVRYLGGAYMRVLTVHRVDVFALSQLGAESAGSFSGLAAGGGALLSTRLKSGWVLLVPIRWSNSTSGLYRFSVGFGVGFKSSGE